MLSGLTPCVQMSRFSLYTDSLKARRCYSQTNILDKLWMQTDTTGSVHKATTGGKTKCKKTKIQVAMTKSDINAKLDVPS